MNLRHSLHERLSNRRALIGFLQSQPNFALAELAGICGYDFLFLDGEHGVLSEADYLHTMQVLAAVNVAAIVRIAGHEPHAVGRYLDMGADAIVVPNVSTAEQAQALVGAMQYPPGGTRGFGASLHRATRYGMDLDVHLKGPREGVCLLPIIESALGVANVEDILRVEGVDGVIVGPSDLAMDLGCPGDFTQPVYTQALARVEQAAKTRNKLLGTAPHSGHSLETLLVRGHRLFILGADMALMREAMSAQVANARACV